MHSACVESIWHPGHGSANRLAVSLGQCASKKAWIWSGADFLASWCHESDAESGAAHFLTLS
jgi:hypothetical protein